MKERIIRCENCKEETRQLVGRKHSVQKGQKREIKHCTKCNQRVIKSKKKGQYIKDYSNKNGREKSTTSHSSNC